MRRPLPLLCWLGCWLLVMAVAGGEERVDIWPQWRGPLGTGVAPGADPPIHWNENENVRWKRELPGRGHATPVVWGDLIFVTSALAVGEGREPIPSRAPGAHDNLPVTHQHQFLVLALRRDSGETVWQQVVHEAFPQEGGHYTGSLASNSPVTDGERVYAFFGSHGLYCLDFSGKLLWKAHLGQMQSLHGHGEGASPALHGETLVVNWDHEGQSFVAALDKRTGETRWKINRDEVTSWASPLIVEHAGRVQVIVSGTQRIRSYDLETGGEIWQCGGLSRNVVASPVAANGIVYAASSYDTRALLAIRLDGATGDITGSDQVLWSRTRGTPYVPSPLLYEDSLYFLTHYQGILTRVDALTGEEPVGPFRLGAIRNVYASPAAAAGRVYISDLDGVTLVFAHGDIPRTLSVNRLDDQFSASPVLVGRELLLRGDQWLYCLAE